MKYLLLLISVFSAPPGFTPVDAAPGKLISGAFAHLNIGVAHMSTPALTRYMQNTDVLGQSYEPSSVGLTFGGELLEVYRNCIFGIGILTHSRNSFSTQSGSSALHIRGAYLKFGYRLLRDADKLLFVYTSLGPGSYSLRLVNYDSAGMNFNRNKPLPGGSEITYKVKELLLEAGISFKTLEINNNIESGRKAGLMLGLDLGFNLMLPQSQFRSGSNTAIGPPSVLPAVIPYMRLTVGGGSF